MPYNESNFWTGERGIWKAAPSDLILYNQLEVHRYSCTYVSAVQAVCNFLNRRLTKDQLVEGFKPFMDSGKFNPLLGAKQSDGVFYALQICNSVFGTNVIAECVPFTEDNLIASVKSGSPFITGINYGEGFAKDEQDDGEIDNLCVGKNRHAICIVKVNTERDFLFKYLENYTGFLPKDVILCKLPNLRPMFFQNGYTLKFS